MKTQTRREVATLMPLSYDQAMYYRHTGRVSEDAFRRFNRLWLWSCHREANTEADRIYRTRPNPRTEVLRRYARTERLATAYRIAA